MARVRMYLKGTSPLLMHNIRLADPDDEIVRLQKPITDKKSKKTEEDRRQLEKLEWLGGLYLSDKIEGPVMPTANIKRCFNEAAKVRRAGRDILRSMHPIEMEVPIAYDGPRDIEELYKHPGFKDRRMVKVSNARVPRVRPKFPEWSIVFDAEVIEEVMDYDTFVEIASMAGIVEGLGDNRINGFGRFTFEAERIG